MSDPAADLPEDRRADEPGLEYRIGVARLLNRGGVSAAPLERLPVLSIFDDEYYENYDLDLVPPLQRLRIAAILKEAGFRQTSGRTFEAPDRGAPVAFPKPGILGSDPSRPVLDLLTRGEAVALVTPTQALIAYLDAFGGDPAPGLAGELAALVWEQPANLDKVADWARPAARGKAFAALRGELEPAQAEGIALRRLRRFRSRLPA